MNKTVFKAAFKSSLPVLMGYLSMGMAAGFLLGEALPGIRAVLWGFLTSATSISGALQFFIAEWVRTAPRCFFDDKGVGLADVVLLTFFLNIRYAMYGFSFLERMRGIPLWKKLYFILALTDETYALSVENKTPPGEDSLTYCLTIAALDHLYWVAGVVAGAALGASLPFDTKGVDFAMTALFLVILTDQCREKANRIPALTGLISALLARCFFSADSMLIPAIVLMTALFLIRWKKEEKRTDG